MSTQASQVSPPNSYFINMSLEAGRPSVKFIYFPLVHHFSVGFLF